MAFKKKPNYSNNLFSKRRKSTSASWIAWNKERISKLSESKTKKKLDPGYRINRSTIVRPKEQLLTKEDFKKRIPLAYIQNPYPVEIGTDPSSAYTRAGGKIKLTGKYEENVVLFEDIDVSGIIGHNDATFNFLIDFGEGDLHTSKEFKTELEKQHGSVNPYKNKKTVSVVKLPLWDLVAYHKKSKFSISEDYAEVNVDDTINTKIDIINHIEWLSKKETLSDPPLRKVKEDGMGISSNYTSPITMVDDPTFLGFDHELPKELE